MIGGSAQGLKQQELNGQWQVTEGFLGIFLSSFFLSWEVTSGTGNTSDTKERHNWDKKSWTEWRNGIGGTIGYKIYLKPIK